MHFPVGLKESADLHSHSAAVTNPSRYSPLTSYQSNTHSLCKSHSKILNKSRGEKIVGAFIFGAHVVHHYML